MKCKCVLLCGVNKNIRKGEMERHTKETNKLLGLKCYAVEIIQNGYNV